MCAVLVFVLSTNGFEDISSVTEETDSASVHGIVTYLSPVKKDPTTLMHPTTLMQQLAMAKEHADLLGLKIRV